MAKDSKTPFSNYKSAALSAELRAQNAATLYFSTVGAASVPPPLPSIVLFQFLTFWPICRETGRRNPALVTMQSNLRKVIQSQLLCEPALWNFVVEFNRA